MDGAIIRFSVEQKEWLKRQINERLVQIDSYSDDSLSEYVIVLLTNHHAQESVVSALKDFLSPSHVKDFVDWLFYKRSELYASGERTLPPGETALGKKMEGLDFKPTRIFETALKDLKEPPALTSAPPPAPSSFAHTSKDPAEARRLRAERFRLHSPDRQIRTPRDRSPASHRRELSPGKPLFYRSIFSSSGERMEVERPFRRERKDSLQVTDARELISAKKRDYSKAAPRPRRSSIDRGDRMPSEKARADQKMVRCSYWPNCKLAGDCPFVHPSEICKHFPSCTFGDTCIYIHPAIPCKFQDRCQNSNCNYQHTPLLAMAKLSSNSSSFSTSHNPYLPPSAIPCRFFPNCRNAGCPFLHPSNSTCEAAEDCRTPACPHSHPPDRSLASKALVNAPCRYGRNCTKLTCPFQHPPKSPKESALGAVPAFSADLEMSEQQRQAVATNG